MDYNKIDLFLKKYSFQSKMRYCYEYSSKIMDVSGLVPTRELLGKVFPWELETYLLFSIDYEEVSKNELQSKSFFNVMSAIRSYNPLGEDTDITTARMLLTSMGLIQFYIQTSIFRRFYRYNYFYNFENEKINMKDIFINAFGVEYAEFIDLATFIQIFVGKPYNDLMVYMIFNKYCKVARNLIITRDDYKKEIRKFAKKTTDFVFCVRPSYTYAFIHYEGKLYFPLPHLFCKNITSSLLFRLTKENNELREVFGKEVLESYLFEVLYNTKQFDEIYQEIEYNHHGERFDSSDVMCRIKNDYLFFESKSQVPSIEVRQFNKIAFEKEIKKMAEAVAQLYNSIMRFIKHSEYSPFKSKIKPEKEHIWGFVSILESSDPSNDFIYNKVAEILNLKLESKEMNWIITHIKVVDLTSIERFCFDSLDFIKSLKLQIEQGGLYDYALTHSSDLVSYDNKKVYDQVEKFTDQCFERERFIIDDLIKKGILKN